MSNQRSYERDDNTNDVYVCNEILIANNDAIRYLSITKIFENETK